MKCAKEFIGGSRRTHLCPPKEIQFLTWALGEACGRPSLEVSRYTKRPTHTSASPTPPQPPAAAARRRPRRNAAAHFLYCRLQAGGSKGGTQTEL